MRWSVVGSVLLIPALAIAAPSSVVEYGANHDGIVLARQALPPTGTPPPGFAASRVIYLNRRGVTVRPGTNDSRQNVSSVAPREVSIPPWNTDGQTWAGTVACVRELFAPFAVTVSEVDPGNVPHIEAVFGGSPDLLGLDPEIGGISPFTTDCGVVDNSIVYAFTGALPNDARVVCEVIAQEIAHSYGLDHELLDSDPMTYLPYQGLRTFKDQTVACGENQARPCGINGSTCRANQNSLQLMLARVGSGTHSDTVAPHLGITSPANNAVVPPGFAVHVTAGDDRAIVGAALYIDDGSTGIVVDGHGPFTFQTTAQLAEGVHRIKVQVSDGQNTMDQMLVVTVKIGALPAGDSGDEGVVGACSTGGSPGLLMALLVVLQRRRAHRQASS